MVSVCRSRSHWWKLHIHNRDRVHCVPREVQPKVVVRDVYDDRTSDRSLHGDGEAVDEHTMTVFEHSFESLKQGLLRALSDIEAKCPNESAYLELATDDRRLRQMLPRLTTNQATSRCQLDEIRRTFHRPVGTDQALVTKTLHSSIR